MKKDIKKFFRRVGLGYAGLERPISLLIVLWVVALLVIGAITKYTKEAEEKDSAVLLEDNSTSDVIKIK
jgi:hypothetical protein